MPIQWMRSAVDLTSRAMGSSPEQELLGRLCDRLVELLAPVVASAVLQADADGRTRTATDTKSSDWLGSLLHEHPQGGPWVQFMRAGGDSCTVDLMVQGGLWPEFAPEAVAHGAALAVLLPLQEESRPVGVLQLLCTATGPTAPELELTRCLADVAVLNLTLARRLRESAETAGQLRQALLSRVMIEQAKGMLAQRWDVDPDLAFGFLRSYARHHRLPLHDVARDVVSRRLVLTRKIPRG